MNTLQYAISSRLTNCSESMPSFFLPRLLDMADSKEVAATTTSNNAVSKVDLSRPRYDQNTFGGRLKHFFQTVHPLNIFVSARRLEEAAELVRRHKYVERKH